MVTNSIRQHIPCFVSGLEAGEAVFTTTEELLRIGFVRRWSEMEGFAGFSYSTHLKGLIAHFRGGKFWVCGRTNEMVKGLPEFAESLRFDK